ncbi:uncharacterized protein METZ01_LOCUS247422 [marine metagenome]|uniref:MIP18 family-like domain-containing protein n=1 Tax=marine metagenome TaxID=408172 RepID=A0A382I4U7_9ZZZZ
MKEKTLDDFLPNKKSEYTKKFENFDLQKKINKEEIINCIKTVEDPEIPVNLYDLGLIYNIEIDDNNNINIDMTLTNPNCPVAGSMPESVGKAIESIENINSINIKLVWKPKWTKDLMSEDAKLALDIY